MLPNARCAGVRLLSLVTVAAVFTTSCGKDSTTGPSPVDVAGTWTGSGSDNSGPGSIVFSLSQNGQAVSGTFVATDNATGIAISGTLRATTRLVHQLPTRSNLRSER